jgi:hypothetical protein
MMTKGVVFDIANSVPLRDSHLLMTRASCGANEMVNAIVMFEIMFEKQGFFFSTTRNSV